MQECLQCWRMHRHQELGLFGLRIRRRRGKRKTADEDQCGECNSDNDTFTLQTKL